LHKAPPIARTLAVGVGETGAQALGRRIWVTVDDEDSLLHPAFSGISAAMALIEIKPAFPAA
jgi:hypothetical protein